MIVHEYPTLPFLLAGNQPWLKKNILPDVSNVKKDLKCLVYILHTLEFRPSYLVQSKWVCVLYVDIFEVNETSQVTFKDQLGPGVLCTLPTLSLGRVYHTINRKPVVAM